MKERREGEGEPFTGGELLQRRRKTEATTLGGFSARARERVRAGAKREKTRVMPGLNTNREGEGEAGEGRWRQAALPLMAGGSAT
jgi:hypothetical protein